MIPKDCRRLAEVDFPIAVVSMHAAREKSIRHGHPSTLHLWWARRPLASSRAVLLGLLWPDPCDSMCPEEFRAEARRRLPEVGCNPGTSDDDLRKALLRFIGGFANWDAAADRTYLNVCRALVRAAHSPKAGAAYDPPLVVDPFAGGGSIPVEALRLGCDAFASDLNPVACLILQVMLRGIPRQGPELVEEVRRIGGALKRRAEKDLDSLYPKDPDGATPIAYLWARTVRCESPKCGAEIPLVRSLWLCKKPNRRRALRFRASRPKGRPPYIEIEIFEPKSDSEIQRGTVARARASCLCCGVVLPPDRLRAQLAAQGGGADTVFDTAGRRISGARLLAVVTLRTGETGRQYRLATDGDYEAVRRALRRVRRLTDDWERSGKRGLCPLPDEPLPLMSGTFNVPLYGMNCWSSLFTARQKVALHALASSIASLEKEPQIVRELLAHTLSHVLDRNTSLCRWRPEPYMETVESMYGRQALPMVWDFAEAVPLTESTGSFQHCLLVVSQAVAGAGPIRGVVAQVQDADARVAPLPDESAAVWFTDPPYYFAVPYADLSDFFFVWLKRALPAHPLLRDPFDPSNPLTPKELELCEMAHWDQVRYAHKDRSFFENGMRDAFAEGRRILRQDGIGAVVFAHKTTEGWEALLSGMIRGGWTITGSWPIATEMGARLRARESAALATSVHLVCRPRPDDAPVGDWADVLRELPARVAQWMHRLQGESVRGADLVFACIGPALEIFSRYSRVETAEGEEVKLDKFLERVWETVGRSALAQVLSTASDKADNEAGGAVEEDARLTALFLWTLQSTNDEGSAGMVSGEDSEDGADVEEDEESGSRGRPKGLSLIFDVVRRFAQPLGIDLPTWEGRVTETRKGVVRLLPLTERARYLFGEEGAHSVASRLEREAKRRGSAQGVLFPEAQSSQGSTTRGRRGRQGPDIDVLDERLQTVPEGTTLDRVHVAMLLQASGRTNALRALLRAEHERGPDFLRLANALSALYPPVTEEKRLLDAMLLAFPR